MKIAYLIPGCEVSGGIAVVCQHANRLLKRGHDVILVSETPLSDMSWFPGQDVPVFGLKSYPENVDILVATSWSTTFRVAGLPAQSKCYFVQSDETRFHPRGSIWHHLTALTYCFDFHFLTEARWIQSWLLGNFNKQSQLVPNGLDENLFFPCQPLEPKGSKPRILLEGAIGLPYKGMEEAFQAVKSLDAEVWCVSSHGKPKPGWRCDRFFEHVPMHKMREVYSSCDILLKLSKVEGFFGPPMEMMACGGVSVVAEVTGYDEYIVDGQNALVVKPGDVSAAADALRLLISDKKLYENLKKNGLKTAQEWRWEASIDSLEKFYEKIHSVKPKTYHPYHTDINLSISSIYKIYRGETDTDNNAVSAAIAADNVEKLCYKLKGSRTFGRIANVAVRLNKFIKKVKQCFE